MGRARLTRIDAVQEMAAAVDAFRVEARAALEGLDMDTHRALDWIHGDRREHWNGEVRRGWDRISQARLQLQQARTARRVGDHEPACEDEKKALERAKRRLEIAQEKAEAVRRCTLAVDEAVNDYRGAKAPLTSWLESEASKALAVLRRIMDDLEAYVAMQAPSGEGVMNLPRPAVESRIEKSAPERVDAKTREGGEVTSGSCPGEEDGSDRRLAEVPGVRADESATAEQFVLPNSEHSVLSTEYSARTAADRESTTNDPPTAAIVPPPNLAGGRP